MKAWRILSAGAALLIGPALVIVLLRTANLSVADLGGLLADLWLPAILVVTAATGLQTCLAAEKWRLVEERLCGRPPARRQAYGFSFIGTALGQFLPPPVSNAVVRGGGNHLSQGSGARRGAFSSVWEQLFDFGVFVLLLPAAAISLALQHGPLFLLAAALTALLADRLIGAVLPPIGRRLGVPAPLLEPSLCRALYRLSLLRYLLLTVMTLGVAAAMNEAIPPLPLASAIPLVGVAAVLSFMPAGLGVNEWSFVAILGVWGTPIGLVAAFGVINRVVIASASLFMGALSLLLLQPEQARALRSGNL